MPVENLPVYRHFLIHGIPKFWCALYEKVTVNRQILYRHIL